ncbi:hypothetical protein GGP72_003125 [Salinibacter ruber]|uniref:Uncharacterized protein n=1 Tax=Salinibacter ruber TaxID=146919 RepID=A0A9X2Q0W8_9BACT|nr:hypothetical protein [Salinibacter ruber]MCS3682463.1 hypothetical protein [Salinibacter ruber]
MYRRITSVATSSTTVRAKYPFSQNSPPCISLFASGNSSNTTLAEFAFSVPTTFDIDNRGGNDTNR